MYSAHVRKLQEVGSTCNLSGQDMAGIYGL